METERISGKLIFAANKAITQGEAGADKDLDYEHFTDKEAAIKVLLIIHSLTINVLLLIVKYSRFFLFSFL